MDIDGLCINTIRMLAVDMVEKARSGHPGMPMGAAPALYALYTKHLRFNPKNPLWPDRDRFVLSAGHGSALLYAMLHLTGYGLGMDDIKRFRQRGSITPGHPERGLTPGVEVTTGPLGQGFANAVGMAISECSLAARFNRPGFEIVKHNTYVLTSDGDMMEGISSEAASLAGHLRLGRLTCLYDDNRVSLAGPTELCFTEDTAGRFEAYGWHVQKVDDGNDVHAVDDAIKAARAECARPSLIILRTHIGFGSPRMQDSFEAHGAPLGRDEVEATKKNLGWPTEPEFYIPDGAVAHFNYAAGQGAALESDWRLIMKSYQGKHPELLDEWARCVTGGLPEGWDEDLPVYAAGQKAVSTRQANGEAMNKTAMRVSNLFGGSGDLDPSTKTYLKGKGRFSADDRAGANISFGVREHGMGGILNGIAAHGGLIPFGSTFLVFSDYMRPAIRLAALSGLNVKYVFTHDSVALGEDGPTHQPIEHLASLRAMPGMTVIRPADANEAVTAWTASMTRRTGPTALILTRQDLPVIDRERYAPAEGLLKGGYVLAGKPDCVPEIILIATGSEVHVALEAYEALTGDGVQARVVSMPSWEMFEEQPEDYREYVLPHGVTRRLTIEAGAKFGWDRYAGPAGAMMGIDRFGASAPGEVNMESFGFTAGEVLKRVKDILGR